MKSLWSELARAPGKTREQTEQSVRVAKLVERRTELLDPRAREESAFPLRADMHHAGAQHADVQHADVHIANDRHVNEHD